MRVTHVMLCGLHASEVWNSPIVIVSTSIITIARIQCWLKLAR